jgi:NADH:ubiquinone oxidoreductase subunit 3 (subunit A)
MSTLIIFILVPSLVTVLILLNPILSFTPLGKSRIDADKISAYECGFTSILGQNRAPITVSFYIVGILFLIFDLEIALLIPIVGSLNTLGITAYSTVAIFIILLTFGFVYELGSGALNWSR